MKDNMNLIENIEKGKILKESLKIVNKLADNNLADIDGEFDYKDFDFEELQNLIIKARKLKNNRFFKL